MGFNIAVPYRFDQTGRTAGSDDERHVRDLIEQVLLTSAGERVNRPDFGSGVPELVFSPASDAAAATVAYLIRGALQQFLSDRIVLQDVTISTADDGSLTISVSYLNK